MEVRPKEMAEQLFNQLITAPAVVNLQLSAYLNPLIKILIVLAGLIASFFIVLAGIEYMFSRGNPSQLLRAKRTLKNALTGLLLVLAAGFIFNFLTEAWSASTSLERPTIAPQVQLQEPISEGLVAKIIQTTTGYFYLFN